jgi:hypothetical protein
MHGGGHTGVLQARQSIFVRTLRCKVLSFAEATNDLSSTRLLDLVSFFLLLFLL